MPKLVLGQTPKTFKPFAVKFVLPNGEEDQLMVTFNYKTRTQFSEYLDRVFNNAAADGEQPAAPNFVEMYKRGGVNAVKQLTEIIAEWDLSDEISPTTLEELHDQVPAAAAALTAAYSAACTEGRLGN